VVYPQEQRINWLEYWLLLVQQRKLVGVITGTGTLLALLVSFIMTPIYRAEVLLAPVSYEKAEGLGSLMNQFDGLAALAGIDVSGGRDKAAEYIATLKSRSLSIAFIKDEKLKPVLFPRKWDNEGNKWKSSDNVPTDLDAFEVFDKEIRTVSVDRKSGLVTLTTEWKDAALASRWANSLVKHVNSRLRAEAIQEAEKSISYLEKQLAETSTVEIQQAIYRLVEAQTKKKMLASTREEYAFSVIDPAVQPEEKVSPRRTVIVALSIIGSMMLGVIAVFVLSYVNSQVDRSMKMARSTKKP